MPDFGFIGKQIVPSMLVAGTVGIGAAAGIASYKNNKDEEGTEKLAHTAASAGSGLLYGGLGLAAAYGISKGPISSIPHRAMSVANSNTPMKLPAVFNNNTPITKDMITSFAKKPLVMGGVGGLLGGTIGYNLDKDNPNQGAAIGAVGGTVLGTGASLAMKGTKLWENLGPVGRTGAIIGGAAALIGIGRATSAPEYHSEDIAMNDGAGGYNTMPSSGVKSRLNTINASGDIVFGLNNKR